MIKKINGGLYLLIVCMVMISVSAMARTDEKTGPNGKNFPSLLNNATDAPYLRHKSDSLFELMGLEHYGLSKPVFFNAYKGYQYLLKKGSVRKKNILTICDYSQSSNSKRLYVINLKESRLLYNTYVSHGKNSGGEFASTFSNLKSSNKSSLGFMLTAETYRGIAGYSMRFNGLEKGINNNVRNRDIVLHGSLFVNEQVATAKGMVGNSLGCPAVPAALSKKIIDAIAGGSCFYVNHPDSWYVQNSSILNAKFDEVPPVVAEAIIAQQPVIVAQSTPASTATQNL